MADDSRYHIDGLFADFSGHVGDLEPPESYVGTFQRENLLFAGPAPGRYGTVRFTEDSVLKKVAPIADRLAVVHNATISRFSRAFFYRDTNEPLLGNHPMTVLAATSLAAAAAAAGPCARKSLRDNEDAMICRFSSKFR